MPVVLEDVVVVGGEPDVDVKGGEAALVGLSGKAVLAFTAL